MISRLQGTLLAAGGGRAEVRCDERLCYELLIPAYDEQRLATMVGETVEFHTLHYLEGYGQGAAYLPRLIGFSSVRDRAFFELFTTVKGLGNRKALRALQLPFADVASAIAGKDLDVLTSLPEIGKRTAQTIVAELHGKVDRFVEVKPVDRTAAAPDDARAAVIADAVTILTRLGEPRLQARRLVERAVEAEPALDTADELVAAAFRLRE